MVLVTKRAMTLLPGSSKAVQHALPELRDREVILNFECAIVPFSC
jgi:hypothetical protein